MENNNTFSKNNTPGELTNNKKTTHLNRIINSSSNNARKENINNRLNLQTDNQFVLMSTMNKEKSNLSDLYSPIHTQAIIENDSTTNNDKNENNLADVLMSSPINEMEIVPELKKSDSENAEFKRNFTLIFLLLPITYNWIYSKAMDLNLEEMRSVDDEFAIDDSIKIKNGF